jgi:hypothetical protein
MAGLNHQVQGELDRRIGRATAQSARFFQIIPIKMKRAISIRKATLMMATVRSASAADRGFMSCLPSREALKLNSPRLEMFRFQTQTTRDASGAGIRGGLNLAWPMTSGLPSRADLFRGRLHVSKVPIKRHGSSTETSADSAQRPERVPESVSDSDGSPGRQDSGARRDHRNSGPIRFDPKATRRPFRFQGVTGSRVKSRSAAESASPNWLIGNVQHAAENKEHAKPHECHARLPLQ